MVKLNTKKLHISFDSNPRLDTLFQKDLNVKRLLNGLDVEVGFNITPKDTLIIFDEIMLLRYGFDFKELHLVFMLMKMK